MSSSLMAEDECEVELRDLVTEALENNGVLPKLRAQLRASVFLALDETAGSGSGDQSSRFQSEALLSVAGRPVGRRCLALVRELLACLQLDCTLSVLDAELESVAGWREERPRLAATLGLSPAEHEPVLVALLAAHSGASGGGATTSPPATGTSTGATPTPDPEPASAADSGPAAGSGSASASDEEDSFFDSLPKVRSLGVSRPTAEPPPPSLPAARPVGELPPLTGRGTLPPLRHGQLPSLSAAPAPAEKPPAEPERDATDGSISEDLDLGGDSILSELQSDGLTDDVSIKSTADLQADVIENM
ncbi:centrosomal protein 43-like [Amphibalanus amphitrite]|uniref:centrosomal protein 43-like n=1 Tax=Amphibalanus amphitrite TaxID=1232801 RepID=UPI001C908850|nr:centrosomal protein 43-like [Amphibalanus amphitrite]XP_043210598.1 centrosomal protein 43-like [Amphibalanus amphitrite]XP_043210599.1 centrosomal protein 43-like [Amphibalanus amphitrite]XP_043210600.1 centrosomal protein 43-like [Amphibalanus amphitrite]XP_043210601.1 centrosomal protein 43-like [Amphibalanus amphitrite]XP_043210602.1 centrosomal protein 43-like [Amphibalanus amphitrite]